MTELAEEHLAQAMASQGGLGLAELIAERAQAGRCRGERCESGATVGASPKPRPNTAPLSSEILVASSRGPGFRSSAMRKAYSGGIWRITWLVVAVHDAHHRAARFLVQDKRHLVLVSKHLRGVQSLDGLNQLPLFGRSLDRSRSHKLTGAACPMLCTPPTLFMTASSEAASAAPSPRIGHGGETLPRMTYRPGRGKCCGNSAAAARYLRFNTSRAVPACRSIFFCSSMSA